MNPPAKCVCSGAYTGARASSSIRYRELPVFLIPPGIGRGGTCMRMYSACSTQCMLRAYAPGAADSGFSKIVGISSGAGYAVRRWTGAVCHRSASTRRQTAPPRADLSAQDASVPAGSCADRSVQACLRAVEQCADVATNGGPLEHEEGIFVGAAPASRGAGSISARMCRC